MKKLVSEDRSDKITKVEFAKKAFWDETIAPTKVNRILKGILQHKVQRKVDTEGTPATGVDRSLFFEDATL